MLILYVQVFAMLASVESVVPILGSQIYSKLYNATKQSSYPWPGTLLPKWFGEKGEKQIDITKS